jgi:hypothetical protein
MTTTTPTSAVIPASELQPGDFLYSVDRMMPGGKRRKGSISVNRAVVEAEAGEPNGSLTMVLVTVDSEWYKPPTETARKVQERDRERGIRPGLAVFATDRCWVGR